MFFLQDMKFKFVFCSSFAERVYVVPYDVVSQCNCRACGSKPIGKLYICM